MRPVVAVTVLRAIAGDGLPQPACPGTVDMGTGYGGDGIYSKNNVVDSYEDCCSLCAAAPGNVCRAWTYVSNTTGSMKGPGVCELRNAPPDSKHTGQKDKASGILPAVPPPPPPTPPPPAPPGTQKNFIWLITDDQ
eukprot:gene10410-9173_t